jgi:cytochrome c peroxidase
VLDFYARRDTNPEKFYGTIAGGAGVDLYDDLPPADRRNVDRRPPFGRRPGEPPALTGDEIRDIIAFLGTLTDEDVKRP